jgi:hypothetical protein
LNLGAMKGLTHLDMQYIDMTDDMLRAVSSLRALTFLFVGGESYVSIYPDDVSDGEEELHGGAVMGAVLNPLAPLMQHPPKHRCRWTTFSEPDKLYLSRLTGITVDACAGPGGPMGGGYPGGGYGGPPMGGGYPGGGHPGAEAGYGGPPMGGGNPGGGGHPGAEAGYGGGYGGPPMGGGYPGGGYGGPPMGGGYPGGGYGGPPMGGGYPGGGGHPGAEAGPPAAAAAAAAPRTLANQTLLGNLSALTHLNLSRLKVSDEGLRVVSNMSSLTWLSLADSPEVTAKGWPAVGKLTNLTHLDVNNAGSSYHPSLGMTDEALQAVGSGLKALTFLNLHSCSKVANEGLRALSGCVALTDLNLESCSLDAGSMLQVGRLTTLKSLDVTFCMDDAEGLCELSKLTALTFLKMESCYCLSVAGVRALRALTALTDLNFQDCEMHGDPVHAQSDAVRELCDSLPSLTALELSGTSMEGQFDHLRPKNSLRALMDDTMNDFMANKGWEF